MSKIVIDNFEDKKMTVTVDSDGDIQVEIHQEKVTVTIYKEIADQDIPY